MHFVSNGPTARAKTNIDAFREALAKRGAPAQPKAEFKGGVAIGVSRQVVVAETEAEARGKELWALRRRLQHVELAVRGEGGQGGAPPYGSRPW